MRSPLLFLSLSLLSSRTLAQDRSSEASEALITDPNQECTPYSYPAVTNAKSSFPAIWEPASIVPNDSAAQAKWNEIKDKVPTNINPKGTHNGDFTGVSYTGADPDCWWTYTGCVTPKLQGLPPDIASVPEPLTVGYGFDDGPNCSHNAFYDFLHQNNQKATMFFIGSNVLDWPLEAQRAITEGHEICVHTWSHNYMTSFASEDAFAELYYTMQAIKLVIGVTPTCWRPPYGDVDDRIRAIATGLGLSTILWQYDSDDWRVGPTTNTTPAQVDANYQTFINGAQNGTFNTHGGIILTHELNNFTMSEAIKEYPQLKAAFKYIVPVGVALNKTQPYVEANYSLPSFEQYIAGTTVSNGSSTQSSSSGRATPTSASATRNGSPTTMIPSNPILLSLALLGLSFVPLL